MKGTPPNFKPDLPFYENLLSSLSDGIMVLNEEKRIIYVNPAWEQLCRVSFASIRELPFHDFALRNPHLESLVEKTMETGASHHEMDYSYRTPDGGDVPVFITTSLIAGIAGTTAGLALTFQDISYFKEIETNTKQAHRLHLLGKLAATMAHEIKNPLGGIRGSAQLLDMETRDQDQKVLLQAIIKEVDRINRIVETALDLKRSRELRTSPVNIHKTLNEILLLEKRNEKSSGINFKVEFDPSIPHIPADEAQLTQLFLNLIRNGVEAMDGEGEMAISTRVSSEYQVQQDAQKPPSRMLLVEVRDKGKGIPPEVRENLFTPFFTTKKAGSGLGLIVCQQVAEKHKGWIKLGQNPEGGTSVKVWLPLK